MGKDNRQSRHEFTLVLAGVHSETAELEDLLFAAQCDDALIHFRNSTVYLDFSREAPTLEGAVISAIQSIESGVPGATVVSVLPDDFVSEAEIARRLHKGRQTISLWVRGERRKSNEPFPGPISNLSDKSPLWSWYEVAQWLLQNHIIADSGLVESALLMDQFNAVLRERDPTVQNYRKRLLVKLQKRAA
jgi:hypothetical protein